MVMREARRAKLLFRSALERALRLGLERMRPQPCRTPFCQRTFRLGDRPAGCLDKALQLAAMLDDEEIIRKLATGR